MYIPQLNAIQYDKNTNFEAATKAPEVRRGLLVPFCEPSTDNLDAPFERHGVRKRGIGLPPILCPNCDDDKVVLMTRRIRTWRAILIYRQDGSLGVGAGSRMHHDPNIRKDHELVDDYDAEEPDDLQSRICDFDGSPLLLCVECGYKWYGFMP